MNSKRRTWLQATVATAGAAALALGGAAMPAFATESSPEPAPEAVTLGSDKYALAAAQIDSSAEEVKSLEARGDLGVSDHGFVYYIDEARTDVPVPAFAADAAATAVIPGTPAEGSRPDAPVTIYLDFDGETLEGTHWNTDSNIPSLAFAATAGASATVQQQVWASVSEDYAPFNVNVTTTRPSDEALYKTAADDNAYGAHVIITDSYDDVLPAADGTGGIAWLNGAGSEYLSGALVFTSATGGTPGEPNAKGIAEAAAHEAGHNLGLEHDSIAGSTTGYYGPNSGLWAPVMGVAYDVPISQWSAGEYAGADNTEDDLSIITDRSAANTMFLGATYADGTAYTKTTICVVSGDPQDPKPGDVFRAVNDDGECGEELTLQFTYTDRAEYAADQIGNTPTDASTLDNSDGTFKASTVIETTDDVDVFKLTVGDGAFKATVDVAEISPNLDAKLTLLNEAGEEVAMDNPDAAVVNPAVAQGLGAELSEELEAGTYFLAVEGVGFGDPTTAVVNNSNGYVEYGSLGNYTLSGTATAYVAPLEAPAVTNPADGSKTEDTTPAISGTGTAGAEVEVTLTGADGDVVLTGTVGDDGKWSITVPDALALGDYTITATQTLKGETSDASAPVKFSVVDAPLAAPVVTDPADGSTTEDTTPIITGTGVAGADVTVTVTDASGKAITLTGKVGTDGKWSVVVETALAAGEYTVFSTETLNGETSKKSATVTFTVAAAPGTDAGGSAGAGGAAGGSADSSGSNDAAAGADAGASGTSAATGNSDGNLANTGSDFSFAPIAFFTLALLLAGGVVAAVGVRQRRRFAEEV